MAQIYEGMFVLDNENVRAGWSGAKAIVIDLLTKHGGTVTTARHWGERNLAYPIQGKSRATYMLAYYELPNEGLSGFVRDLDLSVPILRYLLLAVDAIPEGEVAEAEKEVATDFALPEPPRDDVGEYRLWEETDEDRPRGPRREGFEESYDFDDADLAGPVSASSANREDK